MKTANGKLVKGICECALNTLRGNIPLINTQKAKLTKHKKTLRKLINKNSASWKNKKRLIVQKGDGFLTALLAPLLGTILSALMPSRQ